jgi:hypothetical protein
MTIDTYQLSEEQYTEFFEDNARFACQLYLKLNNIASSEGVGNIDYRTLIELYNDSIYASNEDCRQYQKQNNPEIVSKYQEDLFIYGSPSREEMMEEIKSVNANVKELAKYIANLTDTIEKIS